MSIDSIREHLGIKQGAHAQASRKVQTEILSPLVQLKDLNRKCLIRLLAGDPKRKPRQCA